MKTNFLILSVSILTFVSPPLRAESATENPIDLVAHEWGTFTAVVGSDGFEVPWWTPTLEGPAALPIFVKPPANLIVAGKAGWRWNPALIRMETPVIYFYAKRAAEVTVTVDTSRVRLTEVYPATIAVPPAQSLTESQWRVEIRPPQDTIGKSMPAVGDRGAHYAHAREVPEAWWVVRPNQDGNEEVEKFIFYRGTGDIAMPKRIYRVSDKGTLLIAGQVPCYLVEVDEAGLRWKRIEPSTEENSGTVEIAHPSLDEKAASDEGGLASELISQLTSAGLTNAESTAMVKTWREAWLGEPGLRLLEILPRPWVDEKLPLAISPKPSEIERVFVARWELLTPETETEVLKILELTASPESKFESLAKLDLQRFGAAAFERAAKIRDARFRSDYQKVMMSALNPLPITSTVPSP